MRQQQQGEVRRVACAHVASGAGPALLPCSCHAPARAHTAQQTKVHTSTVTRALHRRLTDCLYTGYLKRKMFVISINSGNSKFSSKIISTVYTCVRIAIYCTYTYFTLHYLVVCS